MYFKESAKKSWQERKCETCSVYRGQKDSSLMISALANLPKKLNEWTWIDFVNYMNKNMKKGTSKPFTHDKISELMGISETSVKESIGLSCDSRVRIAFEY
ncbi:hypothetical protein GOV13_03410 [Candidatus Pacearchaeota archaeon]|nr:hypothetical protein [Candidatus Pacearchaeota archaeon]